MEDLSTLFRAETLEDDLQRFCPEAFQHLLKDHTTGGNIFWATRNYEETYGKGYEYKSPITAELITGEHGNVVMPRVYKDRATQRKRTKEKAEIFTPSWICNEQINLVDGSWFEKKDVFNHSNGDHTWNTKKRKIPFSQTKGKTWRDYVRNNCLEMACGEAPYLVSRYDTVSGVSIPLINRIGLLDRKLRVVTENTHSSVHWLKWAQTAFKSTYGFEWQGDSLLIARENLVITFLEYYHAKFHSLPSKQSVKHIAYIVSWNLWQMDGLKSVVPDSCGKAKTLFGEIEEPCPGCKAKGITGMKIHNGTYCLIRNWNMKKENQIIRFVDCMKDNP